MYDVINLLNKNENKIKIRYCKHNLDKNMDLNNKLVHTHQ